MIKDRHLDGERRRTLAVETIFAHFMPVTLLSEQAQTLPRRRMLAFDPNVSRCRHHRGKERSAMGERRFKHMASTVRQGLPQVIRCLVGENRKGERCPFAGTEQRRGKETGTSWVEGSGASGVVTEDGTGPARAERYVVPSASTVHPASRARAANTSFMSARAGRGKFPYCRKPASIRLVMARRCRSRSFVRSFSLSRSFRPFPAEPGLSPADPAAAVAANPRGRLWDWAGCCCCPSPDGSRSCLTFISPETDRSPAPSHSTTLLPPSRLRSLPSSYNEREREREAQGSSERDFSLVFIEKRRAGVD